MFWFPKLKMLLVNCLGKISRLMKFIFLLLIIVTTFISCKKDNVKGVIIGINLIEHQSLSENKRLDTIIKSTLKGNHNSLRRLNHFPCNGGASCYDKGYIITQIIYKMKENQFIQMVEKLDKKELYGIEEYIDTGLEYGDNDYDGKMDNKDFKNEFPTLYKIITEKK